MKRILIILGCCTIVCIPIVLFALLIKLICSKLDKYSYNRKINKVKNGTYKPFIFKKSKYRFVKTEILLFISIAVYTQTPYYNTAPLYINVIFSLLFLIILAVWLFRLFYRISCWIAHNILIF